jgi:DNA-binding transcriptional LysR family regulator
MHFLVLNSCINWKGPTMNLRSLRTFVTTAELGGLGRACTRLNLSQPAASRQIQALEADLGVRLFEHVGRGLRLTSEGEDLLERSRRLLADADFLAEHALALKGGQSGTLRVAATPQVMMTLLAPFLPLHRKRHPGVEVRLMPAGGGPFARRLLSAVHALAVLLRSHPLSRRAVIEVKDLTDEPLLLLQREYGSRAWFDAACELAQTRPRIVMESTTAHTLVELAAVGYGVAIVPSTSMIRNPQLHAIPIVHHGASIGQWSAICWDPQRLLLPYAERFVDELVTHARRSFPGREYLRRAPPLLRPLD